MVEKIYGPSSEIQNDDGDNPDNSDVTPYYTTSIRLTATTNLDLGYQATKQIKLNIGAINLLNKYPDQINATVLAHERDTTYGDNAEVQIYPSFSPYGINGGFYYAKATYSVLLNSWRRVLWFEREPEAPAFFLPVDPPSQPGTASIRTKPSAAPGARMRGRKPAQDHKFQSSQGPVN